MTITVKCYKEAQSPGVVSGEKEIANTGRNGRGKESVNSDDETEREKSEE